MSSKEFKPGDKTFKQKWNDFWTNVLQKFTSFSKNIVTRCKENPKKILINYLVYFSIFAALLILDQVTKNLIFNHSTGNPYTNGGDYAQKISTDIIDLNIIGFRSLAHYGVTIISKKTTAVIVGVQIVSVILFLLFIFVPLISENWLVIIFVAIINSGVAGNMFDRFFFKGHVKDILFVPWLEKLKGQDIGTFNFADVFLVVGSIAAVIYFIISLIVEIVQENKEKEQQAKAKTENNQASGKIEQNNEPNDFVINPDDEEDLIN